MNVLVINAGSSTLKYQLIDMENERPIARGICDKIGRGDSFITHKTDGHIQKYSVSFPTHNEALKELCKLLTNGERPVVGSLDEIAVVGHRAVHGGSRFCEAELITEDVLRDIEGVLDMAPLHNPPMLETMRASKSLFRKSAPQVVVFDTAFHHTIPEKAYTVPIPRALRDELKIRRYGFHGTSHRYVSGRAAELMGKPISELKIVTCHLGNGSTVTGVRYGKSFDTSAGFSTYDGLLMGTRSGGIDPAIPTFLQTRKGFTPEQVEEILIRQSGLLGLSELTSDHRELEEAAASGNLNARLALDVYNYQIKKFVGAYAAAIGGMDALVFTGGIGENSPLTRAGVCEEMDFFGIRLDCETNLKARGECCEISVSDAPVKVFVIPTNEELLIARDAWQLAGYSKHAPKMG